MEDQAIVALYFQRAEQAIAETIQKYGSLCRSIAQNLLPVRQDAGMGVLLSEVEEIEFILDRPFLFVITNRVGLPLFVGIVNQL